MKLGRLLKDILPYYIIRKFINPKIPATFIQEFNHKSPLLSDNGRFICEQKDIYPCLNDNTATTGFDAHYVFHTAWAARILAESKPEKHVDIGSSLYFVTNVSAFVPFEFYDYRPANLGLSNLTSGEANLLELPFADNSIASLSCMHVVEHIGLERYGDPFDPQGDLKAMSELSRVLKQQGQLLFVVPVGHRSRIQYNAHRIYTFKSIIDTFSNLSLEKFSLITDDGGFIDNASEQESDLQKYGCGCFWFKK